MGHHVEIGGIASSDVVCGLNCDLMLRKRNEAIINREMREGAMRRQGYTQGEINQMRDPNEGDPELIESSKKVFDAIRNEVRQGKGNN